MKNKYFLVISFLMTSLVLPSFGDLNRLDTGKNKYQSETRQLVGGNQIVFFLEPREKDEEPLLTLSFIHPPAPGNKIPDPILYADISLSVGNSEGDRISVYQVFPQEKTLSQASLGNGWGSTAWYVFPLKEKQTVNAVELIYKKSVVKFKVPNWKL